MNLSLAGLSHITSRKTRVMKTRHTQPLAVNKGLLALWAHTCDTTVSWHTDERETLPR